MTPAEEDQLLVDAIALAMDIRDDIDQAHRTVRSLDRGRLEQVCCALAAMVDPEAPLAVMAWWRVSIPAKKEPEDTGRCGTYAGYRRHLRRNEVACRACKDGAARRTRDQKQQRRAAA